MKPISQSTQAILLHWRGHGLSLPPSSISRHTECRLVWEACPCRDPHLSPRLCTSVSASWPTCAPNTLPHAHWGCTGSSHPAHPAHTPLSLCTDTPPPRVPAVVNGTIFHPAAHTQSTLTPPFLQLPKCH